MLAAEAEHIWVEFGKNGDSRVGLGHHERRELALFCHVALVSKVSCSTSRVSGPKRHVRIQSPAWGRARRQLFVKRVLPQTTCAELT